MNRTPVVVTLIISATFLITSYWYIGYLKLKSAAAKIETMPMDRLTVCIQTVMEESRKSNTPVNAEKAREICG